MNHYKTVSADETLDVEYWSTIPACFKLFLSSYYMANIVLWVLAVPSGFTCPWFLGAPPDFFFSGCYKKTQNQHNGQIKAQADSFIQFNTMAAYTGKAIYKILFNVETPIAFHFSAFDAFHHLGITYVLWWQSLSLLRVRFMWWNLGSYYPS